MEKSVAAESPDAYVASLSGWPRQYVEALRSAVVNAGSLQEVVKWGHLVYFSNGPVLLIRAEQRRVLFGFWRGKRLRGIEPRLEPGGKYEMATLVLVEQTPLQRSTVVELVREAIALNASSGDPTKLDTGSVARAAPVVAPTFFETPLLFRAWLEANHASAVELIVGFRKVGTGVASMTWPESVEEALSFGWIDGVRKRIDDESYQIRFTPRRKGSIWSLINVAKVQELTEQGRMRPAGLDAYEARRHEKTGVYAFERDRPAELTPDEIREFRKNRLAWKYFESAAPSYRRVITHWVVSAKQSTTRARRLEELVQACAEQRRILK